MKAPHTLLVATLAACLCGHRVSLAQDDPPKPAPAEEKPVEKPAEKPPAPAKPAADPAADAASDKKARAILAKAAERQHAGDLVEPGKLESFHVSFHTAWVERTKVGKDGRETVILLQADDDGLVVDWMKGSIKTQFTLDRATTTKAWNASYESAWISDGQTTVNLYGSDRKADFDNLMFQRKVIDRLLDVAILGKLLAGDSRWRVIEGDATYPKTVAIERVKTSTSPSLTLWIDHPADDEFGDVVHASMASLEDGDATLIYDLTYNDKLMAGRVVRAGADGAAQPTEMRFPYKVEAFERRADAKERRKVLEVSDGSASLNTVTEKDFEKPKPKRTK
jgi:hypothetical protein